MARRLLATRWWARRGRTGLACLLAAGALGASACNRTPSLPAAGNPTDVTKTAPIGKDGPCRLLDVGEVELALNVTIGGTASGSRTRPALAGMEMCSVRSDRSVAVWGVLSKSAAERFRQYKDWNGPYLESRKLDGRPALWDERLRTLVVLDGSRAFAVRLTVERPPLRKGADVDAYVEQAAGRLAARALKRLGP